MAEDGVVHRRLAGVHAEHGTPVWAVGIVGVLVVLPTAWLAQRGSSAADVYGWLGTLSVFGFLTTYALAAIALPIYLKRKGRLTAGTLGLGVVASAVMMLLLVGTIYPLPPAPFRYFPYVYAGYLCVGLGWYAVRKPATR